MQDEDRSSSSSTAVLEPETEPSGSLDGGGPRKPITLLDLDDQPSLPTWTLRKPIGAGVLFIVTAVISLFSALLYGISGLLCFAGYLVLGIGFLSKKLETVRTGTILVVIASIVFEALYVYSFFLTSESTLYDDTTKTIIVLIPVFSVISYLIVASYAGKKFGSGTAGGLWLGPFLLSVLSMFGNIMTLPAAAQSYKAILSTTSTASNEYVTAIAASILVFYAMNSLIGGVLEAIALYQGTRWLACAPVVPVPPGAKASPVITVQQASTENAASSNNGRDTNVEDAQGQGNSCDPASPRQKITYAVNSATGGSSACWDLTLPAIIGKTPVYVDAVFVSNRAIIAAVNVDADGEISGTPNDDFWLQTSLSGGKTRSIENPYKRTKHVLAALQDVTQAPLDRLIVMWVFPDSCTLPANLESSGQGATNDCLVCKSSAITVALAQRHSSRLAPLDKTTICASYSNLVKYSRQERMKKAAGPVVMTKEQARNTRNIKARRKARYIPIVAVLVILAVCYVCGPTLINSLTGSVQTGISAGNVVNATAQNANNAQSAQNASAANTSSETYVNNIQQNISSSSAAGTTSVSSSSQSGNTYIDGSKFHDMMTLDAQSTALYNQIMSQYEAEGYALTATEISNYQTQIASLKEQFQNCSFHSSYKEFMQQSYNRLCLTETFLNDVGAGYNAASINIILAQISSSNQARTAALEAALASNNIEYTKDAQGTINFKYYVY